MKKKQILFAHQSTIPHYRVEFYNCMQKLKPDDWEFAVVFDKKEAKNIFYSETNDGIFSFATKPTKTYTLHLLKRELKFQTFPFNSSKYDLIIVGSSLDNLSYPLTFLLKFFGKKVAFWGQGKDYKKNYADWTENLTEKFKVFLAKKANLFLAYTNGVKKFLVTEGVKPEKIVVFNNTIDILKQRQNYKALVLQKDFLLEQFRLKNKKVLLYVGRMIKNKKIDFILDAFNALYKTDNSYILILIGAGEKAVEEEIKQKYADDKVLYKGFVPDEEIGKYYTLSDLYFFPGAVGLGPLVSLCYNLVPVFIDSDVHSPEIEYFNESNAVILPKQTTPTQYANAVNELMNDKEKLNKLRQNAFPSIQHLTLENMTQNFIKGINLVLNKN